jgi:homoserine dehydrogenase
VGRAFARYLQSAELPCDFKLRIRAVADSQGALIVGDEKETGPLIAHKESGRGLKEIAASETLTDPQRFADWLSSAGVSVLVESLPTNLTDGRPALDFLTSALASGINAVTADKGPMVHGYDALERAARAGGSRFGFSGTTGVRIPEELEGEQVIEIRGVLNGTTNYILTEMQERAIGFEDALARAQADGIAEPDPKLDVEGWDTAAKILILARALMGADSGIEGVSRIGINSETDSLIEVARDSGRMVRLVGRARIYQHRVRVSVAPKLLGPDSPFFSVSGTSKAAVFRTAGRRELIAHARSGRDAISQTILDDVVKVIVPSKT